MALSFGNPAWTTGGTASGPNLSFGANIPAVDLWSSLGLDFGTPVGATGTTAAAAAGVNTTQLDGQTGFFDALSGFGSAILSGMGVQPEGTATVQQASWGGQQTSAAGIPLDTLLMVGLVGAGIYFAFKK
ncbi:hypothetical protein SAMN06297129_2445 [Pseudooceanicola antarcticus]|uniref:Uncharacterized protein n=1 Tax=Pseudooceanicola antarcticus TaxID=1247613 RepID=A0A285IYN6_9RHOB|nr:hypothetical protein [Pseudooceanicola antarcticus]PJE25767.1 hypothetical protein CVM39_18860 [Pseudooceanicola antarcticus]SNY52933.1 hypothetical protein SAMN06297129_2445 [Pseudooceanicola antarcticus]